MFEEDRSVKCCCPNIVVVEGPESILKKRSARLCHRISTLDRVFKRNSMTTAIERTSRNRNGRKKDVLSHLAKGSFQ